MAPVRAQAGGLYLSGGVVPSGTAYSRLFDGRKAIDSPPGTVTEQPDRDRVVPTLPSDAHG